MSSTFLLINFHCAVTWTIYSVEIAEPELIVLNTLACVINTFFLIMYLWVQWQFARFAFTTICIMSLPLPFLIYAYLSTANTGLVALATSISMYMASLDSVGFTLKTRDSSTVNMALVVAAALNGTVWGIYAILIGDFYVFVPNVAALGSSAL